MENTVYIILGIVTALVFFIIMIGSLLIIQFKPFARPIMPPAPSNFEEDLKFLTFLIGHHVTHYNTFLIKPLNFASGSGIINDVTMEEYVADVVSTVLMGLSPNYRRILGKYFTDKSLDEYVVEEVTRLFTAIILENNIRRIKG